MSAYHPPFQLTHRMTTAMTAIAELLGAWKAVNQNALQPQLRRGNRIRSVQASLAVEQNTLTLEQVTAVLEGKVVPGNRVLLLDDINGWWPASGTAQHLALQRHEVTVVSAAEHACAALDFSQAGETMRERFMKTGVEVMLATALLSWSGNTAELLNLYTGDREKRDFDSLVLATTNTSRDALAAELKAEAFDVHAIGDGVSARTASMAFYEARKLAVAL